MRKLIILFLVLAGCGQPNNAGSPKLNEAQFQDSLTEEQLFEHADSLDISTYSAKMRSGITVYDYEFAPECIGSGADCEEKHKKTIYTQLLGCEKLGSHTTNPKNASSSVYRMPHWAPALLFGRLRAKADELGADTMVLTDLVTTEVTGDQPYTYSADFYKCPE